MKRAFLVGLCTMPLLLCNVAAYGQDPSYPAGPSEEHKVTISYRYTYQETRLDVPFSLEEGNVSRQVSKPEEAMIARVVAMKRLDYPAWLETWDPQAKQQMEERAKQPDTTPTALTAQWRGVLNTARMMMVRRIQTGEYVILTYRLIDRSGRDVGRLEFPSVFHLVGDRWLGTQDLASDFLLLESPWNTGVDRVERTVR